MAVSGSPFVFPSTRDGVPGGEWAHVGRRCRDCSRCASVDMRDGGELWVCLDDPGAPVEIGLDDEACEGFGE